MAFTLYPQLHRSLAHSNLMSVRFLAIFSFLAAFIAAQAATVPNRYIVELSTEPVADHLKSARVTLQSTAAATHRARIQREQAQLRTSLELRGARILESVDTVANALLVEVSETDPRPWANLPNVLRVSPVRTVPMLLDRAVIVNKVADAWSQIGGPANAGRGVKIAILDTGIDIAHPGFQNSPLIAPAGFPLVNAMADSAYTNNKVIVARSYVSLLPKRDPDNSSRDHVGHGTALAMIAAGGTVAAPAATLTGIASGAWIGSYKIFGTPNYNDETTDAVILKALDDATKDGMDVISLSVGSDIVSRLGDDVEVQAVERAISAGVIVVVAAGNNGTDPFTISSPGTAPDAITVGAQRNDRTFAAFVQISGSDPLLAVPGGGPVPAGPVTSSIVDVQTLDGSGLTCGSLPFGSLSNRIALILRGTCTFETKLNNAAAAGASAAVVYAAASAPDPISMAVGSAVLPAEMISNADGLTLKQALASGSVASAVVSFSLGPVHLDPKRISTFSASGPNVDFSIKPDLVAVGESYYVATQSFDVNGEMYSPDGYILVDGTSFSTPTVAGAAALLKAARPGLTVAQYRSLLINSATSLNFGSATAAVQQAGAGSLNSGASLQATAAVYPTSLSFGTGDAFPQGALNLTVTNTSTASDTFTLRANPTGAGPVPSLSLSSVRLGPGASAGVSVTLTGSNLVAGGYEGLVLVAGANGTVESRVPYWYGVASTTPARITDLGSITSASRNSRQRDAIHFRVTDAAGLPITSITPKATVTAGNGTVTSLNSYDSDSPDLFSLSVRLGPLSGTNIFHVQAGDVVFDFNITGN